MNIVYNRSYIEKFFVGLLEGDGRITTNINSSSKTIRVRFVIALKNDVNNKIMLDQIKEVVGGKVVIERAEKYVTWFAISKNDINKVLIILARYPLLTIRKQCELEFAKNCLLYNRQVDNFLEMRSKIYDNKNIILSNLNIKEKFEFPVYFGSWLSGFIEAEGNFSLVFNDKGWLRKSSFCIGQNDELRIVNMIKFYFNSKNKILKDKKKDSGIINKDYYRLCLYNAESRNLLFNHFETYPLLGQKRTSYEKFLLYYSKN